MAPAMPPFQSVLSTSDGESPELRPIRDHQEFAEVLRVRIQVFVEEQGGPIEEEPDPWDSSARHFAAVFRGRVVGTARVYLPAHRVAKVGRVGLLPEFRRRGWGRLLMEEVLRYASALGVSEVVLDAQLAVLPFYERLGFTSIGEPFVDAGVPHVMMRRPATYE
jgi:predicted GNAT family N-acyltransferase